MISREELLTILNSLITEKNVNQIQQYISLINRLDDKALQEKLKELRIKNARDVKRALVKNASRDQRRHFTPLNDLISYGRDGDTIHIHVVPTSVRSMMNTRGIREAEYKLIDALEQIQTLLKTDRKFKHIKNVYAVSPIIAGPVTRIFNNLNFDVKSISFEEAKWDKELSKFYKRFEGSRDGKDPKYFGRAELPKEVVLSETWNELAKKRKRELDNFLKYKNILSGSLGDRVNTEITEEEVKGLCGVQETPTMDVSEQEIQ